MLHALNNFSTVKIDPWKGQKCPLVQKWTNLWVFHFLVIIVWMSNLSIIYFLHLSIQNQLHESLNSTRQFQIEDEIFLLLSPEDVFLGQVMLKVKLWTNTLMKVRVFCWDISVSKPNRYFFYFFVLVTWPGFIELILEHLIFISIFL